MTTHRRTLTTALVGAALVAVLAGCGSESGDGGSTADAGDATTSTLGDPTSSAADEPAGTDVVSVSVRRSGGLKGGEVARVFSRDAAPPERFTDADVDDVLSAAQTVVDDEVDVPQMPANTCCDRYTYVVVVTLADGSTQTYTTLDGMRLPPEMTALLRALA